MGADIEARYIQHMGSDLVVVNAARVSFHKTSMEFSDRDDKLLNFLARNKHWSPFSHCAATFYVRCPIFVARQAWKSHIGFSGNDYGGIGWNEVSRRYVEDEPEFYIPAAYRERVADKKQGSGDALHLPALTADVKSFHHHALHIYYELLSAGVAPEMARMHLPQSMITEWWWTGSLAAWARFCALRLESDAQGEIRMLADSLASQIEPLFPCSWRALMQHGVGK